MKKPNQSPAQPFGGQLSRRERQIMDFLFQHRAATAAQVMANLPDPPTYSAVRAMLATLESKGYVRHHAEGLRYIYEPTTTRETAQHSVLRHMVKTFFDDSVAQAVSALLSLSDQTMSPAELDRLTRYVAHAKREDS